MRIVHSSRNKLQNIASHLLVTLKATTTTEPFSSFHNANTKQEKTKIQFVYQNTTLDHVILQRRHSSKN